MKEVGRRTVLCFGLASGTLSLLGRDANADDSAKRKRSTASVSSFPYSVPSSGQALLIGNNFAEDVRPPSHSAHQWNYSLFFSYGGGTFVEDYSAGGAYVIAGSGGHAVPPNFGGCLFDFADATWKRIDNANGMPWMEPRSEFSGYSERSTASVRSIIRAFPPASRRRRICTATCCRCRPRTAEAAEAPRCYCAPPAAGSSSNHGSGYAHRFDLSTGLWTRQSTNAAIGRSRLSNRMLRPGNESVLPDSSASFMKAGTWTIWMVLTGRGKP